MRHRCVGRVVRSAENLNIMRIGIVFHKDPFAPPAGIDLVRLRAIAGGLIGRGIDAEILSPVPREGLIEGFIPVRNLSALEEDGRYDLIKTCYHYSITLIGAYKGPVVSRIVRVVDEQLPERDEPFREQLLRCQQLIKDRASAIALNNEENRARWRLLYGNEPPTVLVPTGCPTEIPMSGSNPYPPDRGSVLFLGSLAAPRMVGMLNAAAEELKSLADVHLIGSNKACMYGGDEACVLDPLIIDHGELPEEQVWRYIRHASIGLAFATGLHPFDNDVSKILNYLRGGLPVLSERPIVNNELVRKSGYGETFAFGEVPDMIGKARKLLENPPVEQRESVMRFMASEHSWDRRVDTYVELFKRLVASSSSPSGPAAAPCSITISE